MQYPDEVLQLPFSQAQCQQLSMSGSHLCLSSPKPSNLIHSIFSSHGTIQSGISKTDWILHTGATNHMVHSTSFFTTLRSFINTYVKFQIHFFWLMYYVYHLFPLTSSPLASLLSLYIVVLYLSIICILFKTCCCGRQLEWVKRDQAYTYCRHQQVSFSIYHTFTQKESLLMLNLS